MSRVAQHASGPQAMAKADSLTRVWNVALTGRALVANMYLKYIL